MFYFYYSLSFFLFSSINLYENETFHLHSREHNLRAGRSRRRTIWIPGY